MPNKTTQYLQNDLIAVMEKMDGFQRECVNIYDLYWKTDVNTLVSPKLDTDPVAVEAKLHKVQLSNGISFVENLNNFFQNASVTTSDYLANLLKIIYDNADLGTPLSETTEQCCNKLKQLAIDVKATLDQIKTVTEKYFDNEVGLAVGALSDETVLFGTDISISEINSGITLLQQFENMIENSTVTTGDYSGVIAKYLKYETL